MNKLATNIAASTAIIAMTAIGCRTDLAFVATASAATRVAPEQQAAQAEGQARAAMQRGEMAQALALAEQAVAHSPQDVGYRMLLADLYLKNGRFRSAEMTYRDVLHLDPANDRAGLSVALTQIAQGRSHAAMGQLESLVGSVPASDVGLAMALAGQPQRAIALLEPAARETDASARTRQNLALAYAFAGDWQRARTIAAQDVSPAELSARLQQWAAMSRPATPGGQVAALLGVTPQHDAGQPIRLALSAPPQDAPVFAEAVPADVAPAEFAAVEAEVAAEADAAAVPEAPVQMAEAPVEVLSPIQYAEAPVVLASAEVPAAAAPAQNWWPAPSQQAQPAQIAEAAPAPAPTPAEAPAEEEGPGPIDFGRDSAPVQAAAADSFVAPPLMNHAPTQEARVLRPVFEQARPRVRTASAVVPRTTSGTGAFVVQLGAFANPDNAQRAWTRAQRRYGFAQTQARTTTISMNGRTLTRVSVGGFADRGSAVRLCATIRTGGGTCFVRTPAGDAPVHWAARPTRNGRG